MTTKATSNGVFHIDALDGPETEILLQPFKFGEGMPKIKLIDIKKLMKAYNHWLAIPEDKVQTITEVWQLMTTSRVIVEDMRDASLWVETPRGLTVHSVYGIPNALNSANFAECLATLKCLQLDNPKGPEIYLKEGIQFCRGEASEILWTDESFCPSEDVYRKMCVRKLGSYFRLPLKLMELFTDTKLDLAKLTDILAQLYQIYDDYVNIRSPEYQWSKNFVGYGMFCFPVVHAVQNQIDEGQLTNLLKNKPGDDQTKMTSFELLQSCGSLEYTRQALVQLRDEALEELKKFDANPYMVEFVEDVISNLDKVF